MAGRVLGLVLAFLAMTAASSGVEAYSYKDIHDFCKEGGSCPSGAQPQGANMTADPSGNVFGTTPNSVFELVAAPSGKWKFKPIYTFCSQAQCADGDNAAGIVSDVDGVLYGTTSMGGAYSSGTAYRLVPSGHGSKYKYFKLYDFCSPPSCSDGLSPTARALTYAGAASGAFYDGKSALYGTFREGLTTDGKVFALKKGKNVKDAWIESTVYQFCPDQDSCPDGSEPEQVVMDETGKIIRGVSYAGGAHSAGTIFQLSANGSGWSETVLYSFCAAGSCSDGMGPENLAVDGNGDLYGTTLKGGDVSQGVIFQFDPSSQQYTRRYSFCAETGCADGRLATGLSIDARGNLFGAAAEGGGTNNAGVVFELSGSSYQALYTFCPKDGCADGEGPESVPFLANGDILGTAQLGGKYQDGVIYELKP